MHIAVVGTGLMGAGMARSLRREGHDVVAWNRTAARAEPLAKDGIKVAESVTEAVSGADAVITMLFDADATLAIADELLAALGPDSVWIQAGTVGVDGAQRIARVGGERVLDAPVLGTKKPAEEGKLVVLVSGPAQLIDAAQPAFDAIGGKTIVVGPAIGAASALKLACNAWVALITVGTAQSLAFAQSLGVEPSMFLQAIEGGPVDSAYAQLKGKLMLAGEFDASFALDGVVKDLSLMVSAADGVDFPAELIETVRAVFERASAQGHGDEDMAAVRYSFPAG
jgi:3-hydroxyisobutyrate dehydrogenase